MTTHTPLNKIRRAERAKDDAWITAFLHRAPFGSLATVREGQPFIVMRNFAYDEEAHAIYLHGATQGRTHDNVRHNGRVCFSVGEMGAVHPAKRAANFGVAYAGVVIFGHAIIVNNRDEVKHGLQLILDKHFPHLQPGTDYEPVTDADLHRTAVYRIDIEQWSGKARI